MVGVQINVQNPQGNGIEGIPIDIYVTDCNPIGGLGNNYTLHGITNALGQYMLNNAQGYCNFQVTANPKDSPDYSPNWTTATGSTSTTLLSGGYLTLTLQPQTTGTGTGNTCPSGYYYDSSTGTCVQNPYPVPTFSFSYLEIIVIVAIVLVALYGVVVIMKRRK